MKHDDSYYHSVSSMTPGQMGVSVDFTGTRLAMPMGKWARMNPGQELIYVDDAEGRPRALTPKQYAVLIVAMEMAQGVVTGRTMRDIAASLGFAASTVSRALTKLASWGLIAYIVGRGRWAGLVIFRRTKDDGMDRFRKAAQARVRRWKEAAEARVSRLWINVAPYIHDKGGSTYKGHYYLATSKGATLTAQRPWTPEELREAGII